MLEPLYKEVIGIIKEGVDKGYYLDEGLLLYKGRLIVPDIGILRTEIIKEAYTQVSTGYLGIEKIRKLLVPRYY